MKGHEGCVVLADTSSAGQSGSMSRYGRLVAAGLARFAPTVRVRVLRLGLPQSVLRRIPARLATWVQHGWLASVGVRRVARCRDGLVHVLDGSYAYVARGVEGRRLAVTCHDVIPLLQMNGCLPGNPGPAACRVVRASVETMTGAGSIIADSANTRNDLCRFAGMDEKRIVVVPPALDPALDAWRDVPRRHESQERYILHVGGDSPYKNRAGVLRVFEQVRQTNEVKLVLAGQAPGAAMSRRLASSPVGRYVRICHNPSDEQLRQLYSDAALLLFPSLYEGFGWPVLEAMACGCPVVCSNTASLPEVVGDLALMAAPDDVEGLAACCARILTDASLSEQMAAKGQQHAAGFSLERFGGQLMEAYGETSSRLAGSG